MKESLLWSFQINGSMRVNYLFGTMHLRNEDAFALVKNVLPYIEQCNTYAGETDMNGLQNINMYKYFKFKSGTDLSDFINNKKLSRMRNILLKSFNVDINNYLDFKPIFISNLLTEKVLNANNPMSLDEYLWKEAILLNKNTKGVETVENQMITFKEISLDFQLNHLKRISKDVSKFRKSLNILSFCYRNQKIIKLYKMSKKSMGSLKSKLIYERNKNMVVKILDFANNESTFVSIGAAHLAGRYGVLRQLKMHNCILKPIYLNNQD